MRQLPTVSKKLNSVCDVSVGNRGGSSAQQTLGRRIVSLSAAVVILAVSTAIALNSAASPSSAVVAEVVEADVRVTGSVEEGPPGGGISTNDEMRYRVTIENRGPDDIPARSILLTASVERAGGGLATIEVSRFNGPLIPAPGGDCGVGRRQIILCTNSQEIRADRDITLVFANRHPAAEAGQLSFGVTVAPRDERYTDSSGGNNGFRGPTYVFADQPTTTTTTMPTTTTTIETTTVPSDSTTTVDPNEPTTTVDPNETTTTVAETTTTLATTTTTVPTTTTLATTTTLPTTTTTMAPTTLDVTTSIDVMADEDATLPSQGSSSVLGASDQTEDPTSDADEVVLGPTAQDDRGPPYLLLVGIFAVLLLMGGVGLALYAHYNRPPPLVDIRQYR